MLIKKKLNVTFLNKTYWDPLEICSGPGTLVEAGNTSYWIEASKIYDLVLLSSKVQWC